MYKIRKHRRILGCKREKLKGLRRKLFNEEVHDLYSSPDIITVIKSKMMRGAVHLARMGEVQNKFNMLVRKPEEMRPFVTLWNR
jgi:hypothetical protein